MGRIYCWEGGMCSVMHGDWKYKASNAVKMYDDDTRQMNFIQGRVLRKVGVVQHDKMCLQRGSVSAEAMVISWLMQQSIEETLPCDPGGTWLALYA